MASVLSEALPCDELSDEELGDQICALAANIAAAQCRWLLMLAEFDGRLGWSGPGVKSIVHWLAWKCGLDQRSAREKVRIARALGALPKITAAFECGELSYSKVRCLTRAATPENEDYLLVLAQSGTANHIEKIVRAYRRNLPIDASDESGTSDKRYLRLTQYEDGTVEFRAKLGAEEGELLWIALDKVRKELKAEREAADDAADLMPRDAVQRADALVEMAQRTLSGTHKPSSNADRYQVMVHVDVDTLKEQNGGCYLDNGYGIASETAKRLLCDGSYIGVVHDKDGSVLDIGRKTRSIPVAVRRAMNLRDDGCTFPACDSKIFIDGHHIVPWAEGGATKLENLASLCWYHHKMLHEGGFKMRRNPDGTFVFFRPSGALIETPLLKGDKYAVERENLALGVKVDAMNLTPRHWYGETCDYDTTTVALLRLGGYPTNGSAEPLRKQSVVVDDPWYGDPVDDDEEDNGCWINGVFYPDEGEPDIPPYEPDMLDFPIDKLEALGVIRPGSYATDDDYGGRRI